MKTHHLTFLIVMFFCTYPAVAQPLSGAVSNSGGSYEKYRLCTEDNKEEYFYKNACVTIVEQMRNDKCTAPLLEKLRQRYLNPNPAPGQAFDLGMLQCSSADGNGDLSKIAKNKESFEQVLLQFFISLANAESKLDTFNNLSPAPGADNTSAKGGYMNLTLKQMDDPKYNKDNCGCHNTNSESTASAFWYLLVGPRAFAADLTGRSPGPRDDHHSVQCAVHIALYEAEKDGALFSGMRKSAQNPDPKPKGAAKVFASLLDWESNIQSRDPNDPDVSSNPKLNAIVKNVRDYCRKNISSNGSVTRKFTDDIDDNGNLRAPGTR